MEGCNRNWVGSWGGSENGVGKSILGRGNSMCKGLVLGGHVVTRGLEE